MANNVLDSLELKNTKTGEVVQYLIQDKRIDKITNGDTIISPNADFAEVGEWSDENPDNENRIGYFVSIDDSVDGITMIKATSTSDVRGATMHNPAFAANVSEDKFGEDGELLPKYSYVGFAGFVPVIDNGTCTVNGHCVSSDDGTAIPSDNGYGYQVIDRIDETHILVLIEPQGDALHRLGNKESIRTFNSKEEYLEAKKAGEVPDGTIVGYPTDINEDNLDKVVDEVQDLLDNMTTKLVHFTVNYDPSLAGSIITAINDNEEYTVVANESGVSQINGSKLGEWTISCGDSTSNFTTVYYGNYNIKLKVDNSFKVWLELGGLNPNDYESLDDVLSDEKAVRQLMTKHASSDYLLEWIQNNDTILDTLIASSNAMKWIGLRDYICDKLMALDGVTDKFLASDNWEYILKDHVPAMTSDTAPYGEASASTVEQQYYAYQAFDRVIIPDKNFWYSKHSTDPNTTCWISYKFTNPICVKRFEFWVLNRTFNKCELQGSNNGSNWETIKTYNTTPITDVKNTFMCNENNNYYIYYRLFISNIVELVGYYDVAMKELQFYGRSLNVSVPTMTSNTAPYGEVVKSTEYVYPGEVDYNGFRAFDKNLNDTQSNHSVFASTVVDGFNIGYKFGKAIKIKKVGIVQRNGSWGTGTQNQGIKHCRIEYSDDGTNWNTLQNSDFTANIGSVYQKEDIYDVPSDMPHLCWRIYAIDNYGNPTHAAIVEAQFYGVDYSEREFAEGSNIKYIYDHGLVLTPLSAQKQDNSMTAEIGDKQLFVYKNASLANKMASISTDEMIDLTPYKLVRFVGGDKSILSTATGDMNNSMLLYLKKLYDGSTAWIGNKTTKDRTDGLDISSVNQSVYVLFGTHFSTSSASGRSIEEWWLE